MTAPDDGVVDEVPGGVTDGTTGVSITTSVPRPFTGCARLWGESAWQRLHGGHAVVVGVGGVGSWAAEALVRNGVGQLTLIDLDHVAESNLNRQVHALHSTLGQSKIEAMRDRCLGINPDVIIHLIDDFLTPDNLSVLIDHLTVVKNEAVVLDCCDQVATKVALAVWARRNRVKLIMAGAAGGKTDPLMIRRADLAHCTMDRLLAKVRYQLRRQHGFPRENERFHLPVIYSEQAQTPVMQDASAACAPGGGLNCAGYGSTVTVTATMGLAMAAWATERLFA